MVSRLSDDYTDHVLDAVDQLCDRLTQAPAQAWQQLIAAGHAMTRADADHFTRGVALAIHHDRAALLTYSWKRIHHQVQQHLPVTVETTRIGDIEPQSTPPGAAPRPHTGCSRHAEQDNATPREAAVLPLYATIMALVLNDLISQATFHDLTTATDAALRLPVRTTRSRS